MIMINSNQLKKSKKPKLKKEKNLKFKFAALNSKNKC